MVGSGDRAQHTSVVGAVLACHSVCASASPRQAVGRTRGSLVSQSTADVLGYVSTGTAATLAGQHFLDVRCQGRCSKYSQGVVRTPDRDARLRSLIWTKSNLVDRPMSWRSSRPRSDPS